MTVIKTFLVCSLFLAVTGCCCQYKLDYMGCVKNPFEQKEDAKKK